METTPNEDKVLLALHKANKPLTNQELAKLTGLSVEQVRQIIERLLPR